ncbi:MAG: UbiD family decarboxylase [Leptospiraceae bacterium]|nr:UbiD family decarboxylase [Leptospiraceae bacterium]
MSYASTADCVRDLEKNGHLIRITEAVDPNLEMAEIHRQVFERQGPALLFTNIKGSAFPAVSNLFGTIERARFIFRNSLQAVRELVRIKADPMTPLRHPLRSSRAALAAMHALPRRVSHGAILEHTTDIDRLPLIKSWPRDGGPFITLPQVYSENVNKPGVMQSNLGMYRIQLAGNKYHLNQEIGLHYQIHRGIGVHHAAALAAGEPFRVSIFVGGPPAHSFAAVMPLPEGLPEVAFAGALANRRFRFIRKNDQVLSADADFCIVGTVAEYTRPEGPFGDHLGYYSLKHDFPVLLVEQVYHRSDAIWPFTVVGRPPQEDTIFGQLIHEITGPMVPVSIPGLRAMHAVDAAGVHPVLLAIGSERYVPYARQRRPQELLTIANAILGFNQASLAKYLWIAAGEDDPGLDLHDIERFIKHVLERLHLERDLHFQTETTIDTLDYSGTGLNSGSKLVLAAAGDPIRKLGTRIPSGWKPPTGFKDIRSVFPGVLAVSGPRFKSYTTAHKEIERLGKSLARLSAGVRNQIPLVIVCDDAEFTARNLRNFLWVTFTRSNPSHDVHGVRSFIQNKHWGCEGPLMIDARIKPFHAPPLEEDPRALRKAEELARPGGSLYGIL